MDVRMYADEKTHEKIKVLASIRKVKLANMLDEIVNYYIQTNNYSVIFKEIENKSKHRKEE